MSLVNVPQVNPNDEITAEAQNAQVNAIATVVNGNIDDDNVSQLSGSKLSAGTTPATAMTDSGNVEKRFDETFSDYVIDGCVWSALSGLNGTMTTGTISVQGKRLTAPAVATRAFTASKDTYVYLDASGLPVYTGEVANGAAAPTQPANTVRTYKVVTSASAITSVEDIRSKPVGSQNLEPSVNPAMYRWQNYTPAITGFSVLPPGATYRYFKIGTMVVLTFSQPTNGTSNSTAFTIELPFPAAAGGVSQWQENFPQPVNGGAVDTSSPGIVTIVSGATVATIYRNLTGSNWTASGGKRAPSAIITYESAS